MTLEQLQDYALKLEGEKKASDDALEAVKAENAKLLERNGALQDRNNELFLRIEQGQRGTAGTDPQPAEEPVETAEEFAEKNFKEILG